MAIEYIRIFYRRQVPAIYKWSLVGFVTSLALLLLCIVDLRRGFLFAEYALKTPYFVFNSLHLPMLAIGLIGLLISYRSLKGHELELKWVNLEKYVQRLAFILFGALVIDLFTYRGVPAARAAATGQLSAGWLDAFGVTGWLRPLALTLSYLLAVWHATFLGALLAGLALTVLPRYLKSFFARTGLGGSLFGAAFALPQPFCSCCASVITPSLVRQGASTYFSLAFVVGSPMLNLTGLILAALFLPAPYAITRILAGIILTIPVTYAVAWVADRWLVADESASPSRLVRWVSQGLHLYCRAFHLDELVRDRPMDTPSAFLRTWAFMSGRIALLLIPTLLIWTLVTATIVQVLPSAYGNNLPGVALTAMAGTLLMISTWTEIPVALQMIDAGLFGPAAALLVVLPPVSLPCLMILGGSIGRFRVVALLALAVAAAGIVAGIVFL